MKHEAKAFNLDISDATETFSFDELYENKEGLAYYRDNGWLHLKFVQLEDRRKGGILAYDNVTYTVGDAQGVIWDTAEPYSMEVNYPASWDFNMVTGGHAAVIKLDKDSYSGQQVCEPFDEPIVTTSKSITIVTRNKLPT